MGVDIETGSMTSPQRYILQADDGVHNDGSRHRVRESMGDVYAGSTQTTVKPRHV